MKRTTKVWLIIAALLVLIGCILFAGVMSTLRWNFMELSTVKYETNTYEISEAFDGISMNTDTADIVFAVSDDGKCRVECHEEDNAKHSVKVEDGTLVVELIDKRTVYNFIGLNFGSPKITIYLPKAEYTSLLINEDTGDIKIPNHFTFKDVDISLSTGDVDFCASASDMIKIKTNTGYINIKDTSAGQFELSTSTGKVTAKSVICEGNIKINVNTGNTYITDAQSKSIYSSGSTGNILLENVIVAERISVERTTGNVRFEKSDAADIYLKTDTGSVKGSFLSDKIFFVETDTGNINVPKTTTGGRCEILTDTGNINIKIQQ